MSCKWMQKQIQPPKLPVNVMASTTNSTYTWYIAKDIRFANHNKGLSQNMQWLYEESSISAAQVK